MPLLRNLDLLILAAALVIFLAAGFPIEGWLTAAGIWAMWRGVGAYADKRASAATSPAAVAGIAVGSMVGRGWAMGLILLVVGLQTDDDVGLSAAVLSVILFTVWYTTKMLLRPFGETGGRADLPT